MDLLSLFILSVGLAMDAFAVSIGKGLAMKKLSIKNSLIVGLWFGGFQALMPMIGYLLGVRFKNMIRTFDHWIACGLLLLIGIQMIREARGEEDEKETPGSLLGVKEMFLLAVATSIDALAVGVTFAFLDVTLWIAVLMIGVITFIISVAGVRIGHIFGARYKAKAQIAGGIILIILGFRILLEHLFLS